MLKRCWLVVIVLMTGIGSCRAQLAAPLPTPQIDERVELLSIVFRLAGNFEYNMNTLPVYSGDIDRYFKTSKSHPAVQMAHILAEENGVGFDAVMVMAISLSQPPELKPLAVFNPSVPDKRWGTDAEKFLPLLRDFYQDSKFHDFYTAHQAMYRLAEKHFAATLQAVDFSWYPRFYGNAPDLAYHLVLGINNGGGNYGPRLIHSDGRIDLYSIIGCWTHDDFGYPTYPTDSGYLSTIIHEFNHTFVNPAVAEHWKKFSKIDQVYSTVAVQMRRMAYGNAETMVNESLVRAAVILYFQQAGESNPKNLQRIREEQRSGFVWMDLLVDELKQYEAERAQYPKFSSYVPRIAVCYRDLRPQISAVITAFDVKSAHVIQILPFANKAQAVDASVTVITAIVDKPLDPGAGYSIDRGQDGDEHYPVVGKPEFGTDNLHIMLPVQLKPHQTYSFVLTPNAFATPDGYPLVRYKLEFQTK